ncbi:MAG: DNA polymerase III subunit delta, partial [Anaerolineae bacterium]|nr:DNA polymerase III subunit delta [Anaerolineae bacterium]
CRLVVVHDLVSLGASRAGRREHAPAVAETLPPGVDAYLPRLPESTRLVVSESRALPANHPLLRVARELGAEVRHFPLPSEAELAEWIARRARGKGVSIEPQAVALLATYVGTNLRLLDRELEKLATYVGAGGTVSRQDVERLVSSVQEASIFHMVDALGSRDRRRAVVLLRRLLQEGNAPLYILTMIVRQFRLLLQARELDAQGVPLAEMAREMEVQPWLAGKSLRQARNFRPAELEAILAQLLDIDVGIKTGQLEGPLALDLFVLRWAGR